MPLPTGPAKTAVGPQQSMWWLVSRRPFGPYFWGLLSSNTGTWAHNVAQSILMYRMTESTLMVGLVNFAQFISLLLLMPWAGPLADRPDRRRTLLLTQVVSMVVAAVLATLVWFDAITPLLLIVLAFLLGSVTAFAQPLQQALLPQIVPAESLPKAVLLHSIAFTGSRMVGAVVTAVVIQAIDIRAAFTFNALTYAVLVSALWSMRRMVTPPAAGDSGAGRSMIATLGRVRRQPVMVTMFAVLGVSSVTVDPVSTLGPVFAQGVYAVGDAWAGYLMAAFGAGGVAAALQVARGSRASMQSLAIIMAIMALGGLAFAGLTSPIAGLVAQLVVGYCFMIAVTGSTVILHDFSEESERGRVMALRGGVFIGLRPPAALLDGALASIAGPRLAAALMVIPALLLVPLMLWRSRSHRGRDDP